MLNLILRRAKTGPNRYKKFVLPSSEYGSSGLSPGLENGILLRERRESMGITIDEVETATKIRHKYLSALEADEWQLLPSEIVGRGFLRNYASYLDLDPNEMIERRRALADAGLARILRDTSAITPLPPERQVDYRPKEVELKDEPEGLDEIASQQQRRRRRPFMWRLFLWGLLFLLLLWQTRNIVTFFGGIADNVQSGIASIFAPDPNSNSSGIAENGNAEQQFDSAEAIVGQNGIAQNGIAQNGVDPNAIVQNTENQGTTEQMTVGQLMGNADNGNAANINNTDAANQNNAQVNNNSAAEQAVAIAPTAVPPTAVPLAAIPPTAVPPTAIPPTDAPAPIIAAPTDIPPTPVPPTPVPILPTPVPPTPVPPPPTPVPLPPTPVPLPPTPVPPPPPPPAPPAPVAASPPSCPDPRSVLMSPGVNEMVSGVVNITGTATHETFQFYKLEFAPGANAAGGYNYFDGTSAQISGGRLGQFNTTAVPNGAYTIRLTTVDATANFPPPCLVTIQVKN